MDFEKLTDEVFLSIIDLLSINKFDDIGSWKLFISICWLLGFPCEYWDYFSKKSIKKYNNEKNLKHDVYVYEDNCDKFKDVINKK